MKSIAFLQNTQYSVLLFIRSNSEGKSVMHYRFRCFVALLLLTMIRRSTPLINRGFFKGAINQKVNAFVELTVVRSQSSGVQSETTAIGSYVQLKTG
jgi:hypothetical protein